MVSIVVPFLNEAKTLERLGENLERLSGAREVIFVDGESTDGSVEIARRYGRVILSPSGRGRQMNVGSTAARGEALLFLHADCLLPRHALRTIERALANEEVVGGCLTQVLRCDGLQTVFDWIAFGGNLRARVGRTFFGDQGIFCRRGVFEKVGGYPEIPLFEDVEFSGRLRGAGRTTVLSTPVYCSARRWLRHGLVRTTLVDWQVHLGRLAGVPVEELVRLYERTEAR